ncbi:hypothetical protein PM021_05960 [Clostridium perfringens]|uniref:hypothetical protein n=1 Tax=Clostridium perfringens TaxID=1502 RepID=UPI0023311F27|nr:hypothetical protein [Clostridium perfringens]MDB2045643.1 hypothetical protein [Clostridium perfringens]MDB2056525.1 hypothetical protein [Clostridium perfringens]
MSKIKEKIICETYIANAYKIQVKEEKIKLMFGQIKKDNKEEVTVVSSIAIPPKMLRELLERLIIAGMQYEKKFDKKIIDIIKEEGEE